MTKMPTVSGPGKAVFQPWLCPSVSPGCSHPRRARVADLGMMRWVRRLVGMERGTCCCSRRCSNRPGRTSHGTLVLILKTSSRLLPGLPINDSCSCSLKLRKFFKICVLLASHLPTKIHLSNFSPTKSFTLRFSGLWLAT